MKNIASKLFTKINPASDVSPDIEYYCVLDVKKSSILKYPCANELSIIL